MENTRDGSTHKPYTALTLAREADVSDSYVARLCRQGRLPAFKVGHYWLIQYDDGQRWLKERREARE